MNEGCGKRLLLVPLPGAWRPASVGNEETSGLPDWDECSLKSVRWRFEGLRGQIWGIQSVEVEMQIVLEKIHTGRCSAWAWLARIH